MSDPGGFRRTMAEVRQHLLTDPTPQGEATAREKIRRFLAEAETPMAVVDRLTDALLDAAYGGRWESSSPSSRRRDAGEPAVAARTLAFRGP